MSREKSSRAGRWYCGLSDDEVCCSGCCIFFSSTASVQVLAEAPAATPTGFATKELLEFLLPCAKQTIGLVTAALILSAFIYQTLIDGYGLWVVCNFFDAYFESSMVTDPPNSRVFETKASGGREPLTNAWRRVAGDAGTARSLWDLLAR